MRKLIVLSLIMLMACAPLSFAGICTSVDSPGYLTAASSKFIRGIGNVALSWVELLRQPVINENKWEGVGRGIVHTGVRAVSGALEVVTAIIPGAKIPQPDPACPTDLVNMNRSA
ncbi:MAG: hypothetical protein HY583_00735 [Candidatus Omnitrophica bacterium]|nr:hypothetical protein [Candidatus Omnitrophota bacterium]